MNTSISRPIVWSIAGSDSGGGAGIQADIKTMNSLGAHTCTVITAITAQNTQEVSLVEFPSPTMLEAQLKLLANDLPPCAVKLGMLGESSSIETIVNALKTLNTYIICDPVMISSTGHELISQHALNTMIHQLFPITDLLTPNRMEAEKLTGRCIKTVQDTEAAALELLAMGVRSVLIKGGHYAEKNAPTSLCQDFWTDGKQKIWLTSPRQQTRNTHGTGCTLSAAITACLGLGYDMPDAFVIAKAYVNQGLRCAPNLGKGYGPLAHLGWPEHYEDLPWLTPSAKAGWERFQFPDCGETPLGFYPIVNRFEWVEKLLPLGVSTIQLRIKDLEGEALEREIAQASAFASRFNARLFINDYWEFAIKYDAYGVHLGQEDLETANLKALAQSGLRLGISTHSYAEVARALAIQPSYIAVGPIFSTTTKTMRFEPQGLEALRRWRRTLPYPLVAIAGIFLENAPEVIRTGVNGIAVVRDILNADNISERVSQWLSLFGQSTIPTQTQLEPLIR